ncbi:MAG: ABC transporter ATP-binding protein [Nitrososphaerota archaeon]|nr:ABC transporter ATP-binding protein [Nitrososphaerota archaeon]MDG7023359.1 ABC transporter ATP-binding protein [Nitrososphaerota archaeon]
MTNDKTPSVEVNALRREFKGKNAPVVALDGVSLKVQPGEVFGVLGPNGAGKTTMIRILSTLLLPTGGWAKVMGFDVEHEPEKVRRVINMASGAEKAGYDFISAKRNLWFFSQLYGIPGDIAERKIAELSEMLGLTKYLDRKFYALSTGYRQRATIARAFVNDPRVVFLDEPTIGLDVMTARSIREFLLGEARRSGRTIILASHNMAEVDAICDRVAIIDRGKILAEGTPDELKRSLGAPALVMEVSPPQTGFEMLAGVAGVRGFTSETDEERGLTTVEAVVESDAAARGAEEAVKKEGLKVVASWRKQATLEEVFVALVGQGFKEREEEDVS